MQAELRPQRYTVVKAYRDEPGTLYWPGIRERIREFYPDAVMVTATAQGQRIPGARYVEFDFTEGGEGTVLLEGQVLVIAPDEAHTYEILTPGEYDAKYRTLGNDERLHRDNRDA